GDGVAEPVPRRGAGRTGREEARGLERDVARTHEAGHRPRPDPRPGRLPATARRPGEEGAAKARTAPGAGRGEVTDVTRLLEPAPRGARQAAAELLPLVYDELRKLAAAKMAREKPGQTLDATALVHEAYLRLVGDQQFEGRRHFFAAAAEAMRRLLV